MWKSPIYSAFLNGPPLPNSQNKLLAAPHVVLSPPASLGREGTRAHSHSLRACECREADPPLFATKERGEGWGEELQLKTSSGLLAAFEKIPN
jgi:hypothetical protein